MSATSNAGQTPLDLATFASAFALRASTTAWLIGAGGSAESQVPTAAHLIDLLLAELYCRENNVTHEALLNRDRWQDIVYPIYDGQGGLPTIRDTAFYSAIFERVYPDRDARARFVMSKLDGRQPNYGQHVLAGLAASDLARLIVTTNFDTLLEDALRAMLSTADSSARLTVLDPENAGRANFVHATDQHPLLVKIHGDLGSVTLSNTELELASHDPKLHETVAAQLSRFGLIVAGYSGRDPVVMRMLRGVLSGPSPYPSGLTWVRRPEDQLTDEAVQLLHDARAAGVEPVHEVVAGGFSDLLSSIARAADLGRTVRDRLLRLSPPPIRTPAHRPSGTVQKYPQVRFGAVELSAMPLAARALTAPAAVDLREIRTALRQAGVRATIGHADRRLAAFGDDAAIADALAPLGVTVTSSTVPVGAIHDGQPDSTEIGMLAEALTQSLGRTPGITSVLRTGQHHMLRIRTPRPNTGKGGSDNAQPPGAAALRAAVGGAVTGNLPGPDGAQLPWAEAVTLSVEYLNGRWLLLFAPDIWTKPGFVTVNGRTPPGKSDADRISAEFIRQRVAPRYTKQAGAILGAWLQLLTGNQERTIHAYSVGTGAGIDATFTIAAKPVVSYQLAGAPISVNARKAR